MMSLCLVPLGPHRGVPESGAEAEAGTAISSQCLLHTWQLEPAVGGTLLELGPEHLCVVSSSIVASEFFRSS